MNSEIPDEYRKGFTKFLNCKIDLRNRVFIPRIETEFWVGKVINEIQYASKKRSLNSCVFILDMFAGSGCIGIAILRACPEFCRRVDFVDNDKKAIEQIKINLKLNKIPKERYKIYKSDLFEKLKNKKYDIIFANPPYVAKERVKEVQPSVLRYEPKKAILAGKKGLFYIKKFLKEAKKHLKKDGIIYLEFDPLQKEDIEKISEKEKYKNFQFFKDQFKKYRWVKIKH